MKRFFLIITYSFALIGLVSIIVIAYSKFFYYRTANRYLDHCDKIEIGMTYKDVIETMCESANPYDCKGGHLQYHESDSTFWLTFPPSLLASGNPTVIFESRTMTVKEIMCLWP